MEQNPKRKRKGGKRRENKRKRIYGAAGKIIGKKKDHKERDGLMKNVR
jgi:hypothetical protein